jgi:bifunctional DNA-binding transcriptional regulator/antitoxin component of YhaV-PrlF toxin-antitoxin module
MRRIRTISRSKLTFVVTAGDTIAMHVVVDEKGRIEIPQELLERFDFRAGVVVDVEPSEHGLQITAANEKLTSEQNGHLVWKDGVLVFQHEQTVTDGQDILDLIDQVRHERMEHIVGYPLDRP